MFPHCGPSCPVTVERNTEISAKQQWRRRNYCFKQIQFSNNHDVGVKTSQRHFFLLDITKNWSSAIKHRCRRSCSAHFSLTAFSAEGGEWQIIFQCYCLLSWWQQEEFRHVGSSQQAQTQQLVSEWTLHPFLWTMTSDSDMLIFITITQHVPNHLRVSWRLMPDDVIKNHREVTKPETTFKILSVKLMFNMRNEGQYWWSLPLTGNTSDLLMILTWLSVWLYRDGIGWNNRKISCNPNSSF